MSKRLLLRRRPVVARHHQLELLGAVRAEGDLDALGADVAAHLDLTVVSSEAVPGAGSAPGVSMESVALSVAGDHLAVLRDKGLVGYRKEGQWAYYSLTSMKIVEAMDLLREVMEKRPELALPVHLDDIERIAGARKDTDQAVQIIGEIAKVVEEIKVMQATIAAAVSSTRWRSATSNTQGLPSSW